MPAAITTRTGQYSLIEAAVGSLPRTAVGVLLLDLDSDELHVRFRRDWTELFDDEDNVEYFEALEHDLRAKAGEMGAARLYATLEESLSNALLITDRESVLVDDWDKALDRLYRKHVAPKILPFRTHLPVYSVRAAAGRFGEQMEAEPEGWEEVRSSRRLTDDMFVAHVTGHSMEPLIPGGSLCVFRWGVVGSRNGRLVLVENYGETGENRYTIKRYRSEKTYGDDWTHTRITLEPLNPEYEPWEIDPEDTRIRVIAEFLEVLPLPAD